jgi:glycosyltransferase involved in cell wall biosynthesis
MERPLRVFQLIKSLGRGGAEVLLCETLRHTDKERFQFQYGYFLPWKDSMVPLLKQQGVDGVCFAASNTGAILLAVNRVARQLRRFGADLLHCHLPIAGIVGRLAGRLAHVPVIYTEHNRLERYHPLTRHVSLATWTWQERVLAVSGDVAASIRNHTHSRIPVEIVPNGVDVDHFEPRDAGADALRQRLGIPPDAPVVGTVAVFRVQKQLHDWLEAACLLRKRQPNVHFLLVGDGPLREELRARVAALGLTDRLHWSGLQQDVRPYLATMDIYLMSSVVEGLPVALLEAMSMRCVVVSTAVGGIPEVIQHGENGFLVESRRPDQLAEVAGSLIAAPEARARCGAAARRTVERRFSIRHMTRVLESTYAEVVARYVNGK